MRRNFSENFSIGTTALLTTIIFLFSRALYDDQPVFELNAHDAKLNNCMFSQNDLYVSLTINR